ncbi:MAG: FKBP-type peptidyl-prolyl cis-trans isomerase [Chthoniobacterales bacterium]
MRFKSFRLFYAALGIAAITLPNLLMAQSAIEQGDQFLKAKAKEHGVKTLPSGLEYKIVTEGKGKRPASSDVVSVHYRGTLINGTEFDSSYKRNEPAQFPLDRVIKGWTEGIPLIKEGGKIILYIPPNLAYGERGAGADIGPNETLIFEVELLKVL